MKMMNSDDSDISFGTWLFENTLPDPFQAIRQGARGILVRELCYMPSDVILGYSVGCGWFRACVSETRQENMRQHAARHPGTVLPCQMVDGELGGWLSWRPYEFHQKPLQDRDLSAVLARWAIEWWHLASHVALMDAAVAQPLHHGDWGAFDRAIARGLDFLICPVHFSVGMRVSGIGTGHWGLLVAHVSQGIVQYTDSMGNLSCGVYVEALVRGERCPFRRFALDLQSPVPRQYSGVTCGHRVLTFVRFYLYHIARTLTIPRYAVPGYDSRLRDF